MDDITHVALSAKLLEVCDCEKSAAIFSLVPFIDKSYPNLVGVYAHSIGIQPKLLDNAIEIFTKTKTEAAKTSYEYNMIKEESGNMLAILGKAIEGIGKKGITNDKVSAALGLISHAYFDSFLRPVHFFLPYSAACSGQWEYWNNVDYIQLRESFGKKEFLFEFRKEVLNNKVWSEKAKLEVFPLIVQRRLLKEKSLGKPFDPRAMIKAIIIRMGELANPSPNYEVIDFSIRHCLRHIGIDEYVRVDREIEFLRNFERVVIGSFKKLTG